jgi:hypothetical protein
MRNGLKTFQRLQEKSIARSLRRCRLQPAAGLEEALDNADLIDHMQAKAERENGREETDAVIGA